MGQTLGTPTDSRETATRYRRQTGEELRQQAFSADGQRRLFSDRSQNAWLAGHRDEAKRLSDISKQHAAEQNRLHRLAAETIFAEHNPHYPLLGPDHGKRTGHGKRKRQEERGFFAWIFGSWGGGGGGGGGGRGGGGVSAKDGGLKIVDLHGLLVGEALTKTAEHLAACRERGVRRTKIITGRGNHSLGGVARVRPEVEAWLVQRRGELRITRVSNGGAFDVELLDDSGWTHSLLKFLGW